MFNGGLVVVFVLGVVVSGSVVSVSMVIFGDVLDIVV